MSAEVSFFYTTLDVEDLPVELREDLRKKAQEHAEQQLDNGDFVITSINVTIDAHVEVRLKEDQP